MWLWLGLWLGLRGVAVVLPVGCRLRCGLRRLWVRWRCALWGDCEVLVERGELLWDWPLLLVVLVQLDLS